MEHQNQQKHLRGLDFENMCKMQKLVSINYKISVDRHSIQRLWQLFIIEDHPTTKQIRTVWFVSTVFRIWWSENTFLRKQRRSELWNHKLLSEMESMCAATSNRLKTGSRRIKSNRAAECWGWLERDCLRWVSKFEADNCQRWLADHLKQGLQKFSECNWRTISDQSNDIWPVDGKILIEYWIRGLVFK